MARVKGLLAIVSLCAACGGGRSATDTDDGVGSDVPLGSGGAKSLGVGGQMTTSVGGKVTTYTAKGGAIGVGGYQVATGGWATGGKASGGATSRGGFTSTGGVVNTGGRATGGVGIGGKSNAGAAGTVSWFGGNAGIAGGAGNVGVAGSNGGFGGTAGASSCNPSRAFAGSAVGIAGAAASAAQGVFAGTAGVVTSSGALEWFVDAQNGSDQGPGTQTLPLKTLSCASVAARSGDTVSLLDGTWDSSVDAKLGNGTMTTCGVDAGVAFAPNVRLRAIHPGAARITSAAYHGICMSGGAIEGIRFDCLAGRPVIETREGTLEITGSSQRNCEVFGLDIGGTAKVTMRPGGLSDYAEYPNSQFAILRDESTLSIEGGKLSYSSMAFWLEGNATLTLHGVAIQSQDSSMAGQAVYLVSGTPRLTIDGGTSFDNVSLGILSSSVTSDITIDEMTFQNGSNVLIVSEVPSTFVPKIAINRLTVTDAAGLGVDLAGAFDLSVTNSTFTRVGAPAVMPSGSGTVTLDSVTFTDGWGAMLFSSTATENLAVKVRHVTATGGQYSGVGVSGDAADSFDFGTLASPGYNVFRGNNLGQNDGCANFAFTLEAGAVVQAVGNTWDANQQGADSGGQYSVASTPGSLFVSAGIGPNYISGSSNAGQLLLSVSP